MSGVAEGEERHEMQGQISVSDYEDDEMQYDDGGMEDYYDNDSDIDESPTGTDYNSMADPEAFDYCCLTVTQAKQIMSEQIELVCTELNVEPPVSKIILHSHSWDRSEIKMKDKEYLLSECHVVSPATNNNNETNKLPARSRNLQCSVCFEKLSTKHFRTLPCCHYFCIDCWQQHIAICLSQGISSEISCMSTGCSTIATDLFVLDLLSKPELVEKYRQFCFRDFITKHKYLSFCPGPNCEIIVQALDSKAKRVSCTSCKTSFCFKCGNDYHSPTSCTVIKKWLTKCADDSETANYITANTKDCPKCNICIEKNGGCNHMQCSKCMYNFCWMCMDAWKSHGSTFYSCTRYKEDPDAYKSPPSVAREALRKYLFYYERWDNHNQSLKKEEETLARIGERIHSKVMSNQGTWIDWQYLLDAGKLLIKCRYTLQYTYPYAYYIEDKQKKQLFEFQQAQLEHEIENLSWNIEHAETTDKGALKNQMNIVEQRRRPLLLEFSSDS